MRKIGSGISGRRTCCGPATRSWPPPHLLDGAKGAVAVLFADIYEPDIAIVAAAGALLGHCFHLAEVEAARASRSRLASFWHCLCRSVGSHVPPGCWQPFCFGIRPCPLCWPWRRPRYVWWLANPQRTEFVAAMAILVWIRHHQNIRRLILGEEAKIGFPARINGRGTLSVGA